MELEEYRIELADALKELEIGRALARMPDGCFDCSIYEPYAIRCNQAQDDLQAAIEISRARTHELSQL